MRVEENGGGGSAVLSDAVLTVQSVECDLGCQGAAPPAPPVGDDVTGTGIRLNRGAGADELVLTFDNATCSGDHAVILYGSLGDFGAYQGAVDHRDSECSNGRTHQRADRTKGSARGRW